MFEDDSMSELEEDIYDSSSCHPTSGDESSTDDDCMNNVAVETNRASSSRDGQNNDNSTGAGELNNNQPVDEVRLAKRGKRRYKDESKWKRNERKRLRNSGKQYHNVSKKLIPEKQFNENMDCTCKVECSTLIDTEHRRKLFKSFYSMGNFDMQTSYICSLIKVSPKQRTYTKNDSNKRNYTRMYYLPNQNGIEIKVCKTLFKATFAISDGRLTRALSGKPHGSTPPIDRRGKQPCQFKTSEEKINQIKQFISKFPTYSSHYSRNKNPSRKYLPPNLNLSKLYSLYKEECPNPVRPFIFKKIFNRENRIFHSIHRCQIHAKNVMPLISN
ncbi:uncharacterized protein LOC111061255 [Nilaparvata lugens]|uniref:uncharacterized protein LOC111061255 n=1 Tax=Nilaparvata lugens TaxID=108931 RepID=UPI00193E4C1E|nr:uncharacterized protein LOC111061255 [Nilaparvata lugens]